MPRDNNLLVKHPKLAKEWHPTKNGELKASDVTPGTHQKVWWKCKNGHEWDAVVRYRVGGSVCPDCLSLAVKRPDLSKEWHPTKNKELTPYGVVPGSHKKVWWVCEKKHEWDTVVKNRTNGHGCPECFDSIRAEKVHKAALRKSGSLAEKYPELAKQWHPSKNGSLKPSDVTPGTHQKVWWKCKNGHEWDAVVSSRTNGTDCPTCARRIGGEKHHRTALKRSGNLAEKYPELVKEWHPTKNGELKPTDVTPGSNEKVWWMCEKKHEWDVVIAHRTNGRGCPRCARRIGGEKHHLYALNKSGSLGEKNPELAKEWHPTKNGSLKPSDVTPGTSRKVWWKCENGHEWKSVIANRTIGRGCPYCSGQKVGDDNNLAVKFPDIAEEWHPKNKLTPDKVTARSNKKVWWICKKGHEWETTVWPRTSRGTGCPDCHPQTSKPEIRIYSELKEIFPDAKWREKKYGMECDIYLPTQKIAIEYDGYRWHKEKSDVDKGKTSRLSESGISTIHVRENGLDRISPSDILLEEDEPELSVVRQLVEQLAGHPSLSDEIKLGIHEYLKGNRFRNEIEYNMILSTLPGPLPEQSLAYLHPNIIKEWHHTKNAPLKPELFTPKSGQRVWRICKKGHEWDAVIANRTKGDGCPYCSGRRVGDDNNLAIKFPEIAKEWHSSKNGELTASDVTPGTPRKVWWICKKGHEWDATVSGRTSGVGCPKCYESNRGEIIHRAALRKSGSLAEKYRELVKEWHPSKNGSLKPSDVTPGTSRKVWWKCKVNPKHEWRSSVSHRVNGSGCPECYESIRGEKRHRAALRSGSLAEEKYRELVKEWHPSKNGSLKPSDVTPGTHQKVWWKCKVNPKHDWDDTIAHRTGDGRGCPYCSGRRVGDDNNLAVTNPDIAKEWHHTKNGDLKPSDVTPGSGKKVWWRCKGGHGWQATPSHRARGQGCPYCSGHRVGDDNNLAIKHPDLAKEWHTTKNGSLKPSDVTPGTSRKVWWKCENGHEWEAVVYNRSRKGYGCPHCRRERRRRPD